MISILSPIEKPCDCPQETILWEGSHTVCECSGGVVAVSSRYGCTVRSSIAAFRVADPGFKSRPEHPCSSSSFSYSSASFGFDFVSLGATLGSASLTGLVDTLQITKAKEFCIIIALKSLLTKSSLFSQSVYAPLNPYDELYHQEKEISCCIHDKPILLLGHLGAFLPLWIYNAELLYL
jgi:hypothetical protein